MCYDGGYFHVTTLKNETILTAKLLDELRGEGYQKIWISLCDQGNNDYLFNYNGTKIKWGDDISRVTSPGDIYPIYWIFGFYRLSINQHQPCQEVEDN